MPIWSKRISKVILETHYKLLGKQKSGSRKAFAQTQSYPSQDKSVVNDHKEMATFIQHTLLYNTEEKNSTPWPSRDEYEKQR